LIFARPRALVVTAATSFVSCCSEVQDSLTFWHTGLPSLSWQLAVKTSVVVCWSEKASPCYGPRRDKAREHTRERSPLAAY